MAVVVLVLVGLIVYFVAKGLGAANPESFRGEINALSRFYKTVYENASDLGLSGVRIMYNVFEYGAGTGSLEGHTGCGKFLSVTGIGGKNDGLARELGADISLIRGDKYYQFILKKNFSKKEQRVILGRLCSAIKQEMSSTTVHFDEKIPAIVVRF